MNVVIHTAFLVYDAVKYGKNCLFYEKIYVSTANTFFELRPKKLHVYNVHLVKCHPQNQMIT